MNSKLKFRDYQEEIIAKGKTILTSKKFLYLAMEVRTGKTLTSLGIAEELGFENVLFITKKKAISSITADTNLLCPSYVFFVINYESLHKVPDVKWDLIICDEAHSLGSYPKPSKRAKAVKELIKKNGSSVILLSGTPTPESYSMIYHQVYGILYNPFREFKNFYAFAKKHVNIREMRINGLFHKNYDNASESVMDLMKPYTINYTQVEAGFKVETKEHVLYVEMADATYSLCNRLKKDLVISGKDNDILADTPVKLMQKLHQMYSGTVKFESGESMVLDYTKAEFIKDNFTGQKIGIFYKFKEELNALKEMFGDDLTTELDVFDSTNKSIALQIVSGREGISLRKADALVYYNIDFSATSYWQSRDRMTTKDRLKNDVYWVFTKGGIEDKIYKAVTKKKAYTVSHFKKDNEL
ncbi:MAG TPA: hypothetical protein EYO58_07490 [Flavobacteriales bacterium]|nr:hypothetical protein [Flavobacteriales bacterium]